MWFKDEKSRVLMIPHRETPHYIFDPISNLKI